MIERQRERNTAGDWTRPRPEMLYWLRDDEMLVQELLQRVQCVIAHVGESFSPLVIYIFDILKVAYLIEIWQKSEDES